MARPLDLDLSVKAVAPRESGTKMRIAKPTTAAAIGAEELRDIVGLLKAMEKQVPAESREKFKEGLDRLEQRVDVLPKEPTWEERADRVNIDGKQAPLSSAMGSTITGAGTRARGQASYLQR